MENLDSYHVEQNVSKNRFELLIDGEIAFMNYEISPEGKILLTHTEVPQPLEGKGIASKLAKEVFVFIEQNNLKINPLCQFVVTYLKKNNQYQKLLAEGIKLE